VIFRSLSADIVTHKVILSEQLGFRRGRSTEDATYKLTNVVLTAWNNKDYVTGIFCDIAKAFDCVSHELLLMKLQYYVVQGVFLQWFQQRRQRVELKDSNYKYCSNWEIVRCDVPQGSALDPLLFNIYINDFPPEINTISEVIMFADNTSILCTSKNYDVKKKHDVILGHIVFWFQNNQLALNLDKPKIINLLQLSAFYPLNLVLHNRALKEVETMKFLGLQLDNHLTCMGHRFSATQVEYSLLFNEKIIH
jgi:hypothetical protein